jgi:threonine/homoserine/homoserine lactone efflux protein
VPDLPTILLFVVMTAALFVIPGPSVIYIVTRGIAQGRAAGLVSVLGMHVGTIPYVATATLGLSALLTASSTAFLIVRYLGAAYLIWLGVQKLWLMRGTAESGAEPPAVPLRRVFGQAVVVSMLNPKTLLFYTAFLPQFVDPARGSIQFQVLFFCAGFLILGILSDGTYALLSSTLASRLRRNPASHRRLNRFSGLIYLMLGVFAATAWYG